MPSGFSEGGIRPPKSTKNTPCLQKKTFIPRLFHIWRIKFQENFDSPNMKESDLHHVYILHCADGTYYTGCTQDLNDRLRRHQNGDISYTKSRLPFTKVFHCSFADRYKAFEFEKYLKSGSGIAFRNKHLI